MFKSGFIAVIGRPNAGKSTLVNAILQEKIAIMSNKAQTTRDNVMGVLTKDDAQLIFIDTPGIHKPHHQLGRNLNRSAYHAIAEADVNFVIADATQPYGSGDAFLLSKLKGSEIPTFLVLNKIDLLTKEQLLQTLDEWKQQYEFAEIIPISALKQDNIDHLLEVVTTYLSTGPKYFPDDMTSDHGVDFQISEIIREKILFKTEEEVPHSVAVVIENKEEDEHSLYLQAMVIVERASQKGILIGKQGQMIKQIRILAQKELKRKFQKKVELELFVRVENNWRNRTSKLAQFGYQNGDE